MAKRRKLEAPVTADSIAQAVRGETATSMRPPPSRHFTADEFLQWVEANCFNLDKENNWTPFRFTVWQQAEWRKLLELTDSGVLRALVWMVCWPRRHGKSQLAGFYDIMRCLRFNDQLMIICANSADQSEETVFGIIKATIENSPNLRRLIEQQKIIVGADEVYFAETGSRVKCIPHSEASAYGKGIHVFHNTELCRAPSDKVYQVGASSTGDKWCGLVICDSNVGDESNAVVAQLALAGVHFQQGAIIRGAAERPSIVASFIGYESLDQATAEGPAWISREWLELRRTGMTAAEFRRNHLNIPSSGSDVCFALALVRRAAIAIPVFIDASAFGLLRARYLGHSMHIGGGLDRSLGLSAKSDRTIWTDVGGGARPDLVGKKMPVFDDLGNKLGEVDADPWEFTVLRQAEIPFAMDKPIKDAIARGRKDFGRYSKLALEQYQARDIYDWCCQQGLPCELVHMTWQAKASLVRMMLELLSTDRWHFSAGNVLLTQELLNYREDLSAATPDYGGPKRSISVMIADQLKDLVIKDDSLESAMWATWALRGHKQARGRRSLRHKPPGF